MLSTVYRSLVAVLVAFLVLLLFVAGDAMAFSVTPPAEDSPRMGFAVGEGMRNAMIERGVSAHDPIISRTIDLAAGASRYAGATTWSQVVARGFPVAQAVTIGGEFLYEFRLGEYEVKRVSVGGVPVGAIVQGQTVWRVSGYSVFADTREAAAVGMLYLHFNHAAVTEIQWGTPFACSPAASCLDPFVYPFRAVVLNSQGQSSLTPNYNISAVSSPGSCPAGSVGRNTVPFSCTDATAFEDFYQPQPQTFADFEVAVQTLAQTETLTATQVKPELAAEIANRLWRGASLEPGFSGVPYDALRPVRPEHVTLTPMPTLQALQSPLPSPELIDPEGDGSSVVSPPSTPLDWSYPVEPEPDLTEPEEGPMDQLLEAMEPIFTYQMVLPNEECPTWHATITLFDTPWNIDIEGHCTLLDQWFSTVAALFLVLWGISAFWIVMEA